jgi:hypothetical protein
MNSIVLFAVFSSLLVFVIGSTDTIPNVGDIQKIELGVPVSGITDLQEKILAHQSPIPITLKRVPL